MNVKGENLRSVKGRRGTLLFIGSRIWHLKRCDQPKDDTWHTSCKSESKQPITNEVMRRGISNH